MSEPINGKIGIVGFGNMGKALAKGLTESRALLAEDILVLVRRPESLSEVESEVGLKATLDVERFASECELFYLCVKSGQAIEVVRQLAKHRNNAKELALTSLCAGIPTSALQKEAGDNVVVIKAITNIDIQTLNGFTVIFSKDEENLLKGIVKNLFEKFGTVIETKTEKECDVISSMSATIPAFIATTISALLDAGIYCGVPKDLSYRIATEVMGNTSRSMQAMGLHPEIYRQMITSPGGVVIRGVEVLERNRIRSAFIEALATVENLVSSYYSKSTS